MTLCEGADGGDPQVGGGQLSYELYEAVHDQVVSEEILNSYYIWYS